MQYYNFHGAKQAIKLQWKVCMRDVTLHYSIRSLTDTCETNTHELGINTLKVCCILSIIIHYKHYSFFARQADYRDTGI